MPENAKKGQKKEIIDLDGEAYEATELDLVVIREHKVFLLM